MKVIFLARHDDPPQDNDDEGSVVHALRSLGHEVVPVHEHPGRRKGVRLYDLTADLLLFFKHPTVSDIIEMSKKMPCAYFHFDMIRSMEDDPTLEARSMHRVQWCRDVLPHVVAGFHSDGDWVAKDKTGKLAHLMQGFDERNAHLAAEATQTDFAPEILFTGMIHHGQRRAAHIRHLEEKWGPRFGVVGNGGGGRRLHGKALADLFASAKVVIAPDGPQTSRYASNRCFLTLGLGGFLVHPFSQAIANHYEPQKELAYYVGSGASPLTSRETRDAWNACDRLIGHYLSHPDERERLRKAGHEATMSRNLYRHRVAELLRVVKERI